MLRSFQMARIQIPVSVHLHTVSDSQRKQALLNSNVLRVESEDAMHQHELLQILILRCSGLYEPSLK